MLLALTLSLVLVQQPPSRQEKVAALKTLAAAWSSYADANDPNKAFLALGMLGLLNDLGGVKATDAPDDQRKKIKATAEELRNKAKLDLGDVDVDAAMEIAAVHHRKLSCVPMQGNAKGNLKGLYVAQESYRAEFDTYHQDLETLQFAPRGKPLYRFEVVSATKTKFLARAVGIGAMAGDEWTIDDSNALKNVTSVCPAE